MKDIKKDKLLSDLMKDVELHSPSDNFTDKLMSQVEFSKQRILQTEKDNNILSNPSWIAVGLAGLALIVSMVFIDFSFITQFFTEISFGNINIVSLFNSIKTSLQTFFTEIQVPAIAGIAFIAIAALFIIDRFVLRIRTINMFSF